MNTNFPLIMAMALFMGSISGSTLFAAGPALPVQGLTPEVAGNDLILSFPTTSTNYYTLQSRPDLSHPWTNFQIAIPGDGTVKSVTVSNAVQASQGYFGLLVQGLPTSLFLPQSMAFAALGHSCGGIQEQVSVTGFDPTNGFPTGNVFLKTTCSTGGRGSRPATFTTTVGVTWDFTGNVVATRAPLALPAGTIDGYGDKMFNNGALAYLCVPVPTAPAGVAVVQAGDEFRISWLSKGVNPAAVSTSTLTATPVNSTAAILTAVVIGPATNGVIPLLQPLTTYQVRVVNASIGGAGPASAPVTVTTEPASIAPTAPADLMANWTILDPVGPTDTILATWSAAIPGDSPVDQYQIQIVGSDGAGTFVQTVSGTTLTASFEADWTPNWTVSVQAHNAYGWGPWSAGVNVGGL